MHTKGKWHIKNMQNGHYSINDNITVWRTDDCDAKADAEHIVHCVNTNDELVEALEKANKQLYALLTWFEHEQIALQTTNNPNGHGVCHIIASIKTLNRENEQLLAKAKGGE